MNIRAALGRGGASDQMRIQPNEGITWQAGFFFDIAQIVGSLDSRVNRFQGLNRLWENPVAFRVLRYDGGCQ